MFWRIPHPHPDGAADSWIAGYAAGGTAGKQVTYAITTASDVALVGTVGISISTGDARAELGYWIAEHAWGTGYATDVLGATTREIRVCRNIKMLANFEPPATDSEIRASALQFVRKLSGVNRPARVNKEAFDRAVDEVTAAAERLIASLRTTAPARNREDEAQKARARSAQRFGT
jgi:hypothetical protein